MKVARSAKIVILDKDGKALLLRRSSTHPEAPLVNDLPGGIVRDNETLEQGAAREACEETRLSIAPDDIQLVHSFRARLISLSVNLFVYRISEAQPSVTLSYEHDRYEWVLPSDLVGLERAYQVSVDFAVQHGLLS